MHWKTSCIFTLSLLVLTSYSDGQRTEKRKSPIQSVPVSADVKKALDFDCPEEFGYYPHPTDCTQYYVCVFGGALLESCTGGLMYSHELQTCDWPRNVGCSAGDSDESPRIQQQQSQQQHHSAAQVSRAPVIQQRVSTAQPQPQPQPQSQRVRVQAQPPPPPRPSPNPVVTSRGQPTHINHQEIVKQLNNFQQQLYADVDEQLPPAEELENDNQQRVLRGQPSSLGAVQRDRDGLSSPNTIRQGKVGSFSFGTQVDREEILQNYSDTISDLTDVINNWTEPSNSIDDTTNINHEKNIRIKRDTEENTEFEVESSDRDKRQVRYGRLQQPSQGNQNNVNLRWSDQKKNSNDFVQFPNTHYSSSTPFKASAQIGEGFSPLTGSGINLQSNQYKHSASNFKPVVSESLKPYSTSSPNHVSHGSSTPSYSFYTLGPKDSKSNFFQSTTATPIYKENFQYFSLKPETSITKSPPISSLKSSSQSPFAALSGGFYNNKPDTTIRFNNKIKSSNFNSFGNQQPVSGSGLQYDYEVGSKKPVNSQHFFVSTSSPIEITKSKPSRLPPVRSSSSNKVTVQNRRPNANYESGNNRGTKKINLTTQRKPRPDQYRQQSSTSPKYNDDESEEDEEDESEDEEESNGTKGATDDADDIKPAFPEPPVHFIEPINKYENIVNPFADPNFDFDSFISKVRNNHLSNIGSKSIEKLNSQVRQDPNKPVNQKVKSKFLKDHHQYDGMSTPRPFGSSVSWPAPIQKVTRKPGLYEELYDEDEYYDDDDYRTGTEKIKPKPSPAYPTKNTIPTSVSSSYKKPSNQVSPNNNYKTPYANNLSNPSSKPPTQQSVNKFRDEPRRPQSDTVYIQKTPSYQSSSGDNKNNNANKFLTSTSSRPVFHSSFKISPTYDSFTPSSANKFKLQDIRTTSSTHSGPSNPNQSVTLSKYTDKNRYPSSTPAPKKRKPIPKPSPEMNDYYYDEDDEEEEYYNEPPVKSKFMPSTEVKPQRPPIAQNDEEYEDYGFIRNKNRKPQYSKTPITTNETFDDDDSDDEAQLKRPLKLKPVYQSTTENVYSKHPNNLNSSPTKTSILIPVKFDSHNSYLERPNQINANKRPELANYEILHSTKLPSLVQKPRYLNQTTLRPYTVRHRLAKPTSTLSTYSEIRPNPTKQTALRHPTRVTQSIPFITSTTKGMFKQPVSFSTALKTDNVNQETRLTDHDDNAPNRVEPVVSSSPSYTRQKGSGGRALFNTTSLNYDQQRYDPYYTLYDDDQELYKDSDYAQQYNSASQRPTAQQPFRSTPTPSSPSPTPSTQHYTPSQAYTPQQVSAEDYDDALINPDIDDDNRYQQPVRSSTTSTLDFINELGFGLSTLGGILRTSISPRVVTAPSTTTTFTTTTTYSPPPSITRAPSIQRSTTSDSVKGNLNPPTERSVLLATKQPVNNSRYTSDSLNTQRLLLQTRRKQLRLLQNKTPYDSQESEGSENVSQLLRHDFETTQNPKLSQNDAKQTQLLNLHSQDTQKKSELVNENESLIKSNNVDITTSAPLLDNVNELNPSLDINPTIPDPIVIPETSENPVIPKIPDTPSKSNTSRFLSLTTGFSFKKDNDVSNGDEPSYTLRVYKTPAVISVPDNSPTFEYNEIPKINSAPKTSFQIQDLPVESVNQINDNNYNRRNLTFIEDVIISSERPKPIRLVVENLPKPGQKPIVIQLKSHTGPRQHGPRIGHQDVIPIYNRQNNRALHTQSQDTFIYFKPSSQSRKEIPVNHTLSEVANNNSKHKILKTVIKRPSTTTSSTVENVADDNISQADVNSSDEYELVSDNPKQSSKSDVSKEVLNEFIPKDIVAPSSNRRNNIETLPNTLLRRKAFREVFSAKTESSLSNQPNVSPFKTLENLLKDERFERTTPTNRFQNNIIATTQDPRLIPSRRNTLSSSHSIDKQFEDGFVPTIGSRSREILSRRTTTVAPSQPNKQLGSESIVRNQLAQNIIQNIYKFSSPLTTQTDYGNTKTLVKIVDLDDSNTGKSLKEKEQYNNSSSREKLTEGPQIFQRTKEIEAINDEFTQSRSVMDDTGIAYDPENNSETNDYYESRIENVDSKEVKSVNPKYEIDHQESVKDFNNDSFKSKNKYSSRIRSRNEPAVKYNEKDESVSNKYEGKPYQNKDSYESYSPRTVIENVNVPNDKYNKYDNDVPLIVEQEKQQIPQRGRIQPPAVVDASAEYETSSNEYGDYEEEDLESVYAYKLAPEVSSPRNYNVYSSERPISSSTSSTTTSRPSTTSTIEPLWQRVTQRNRITITKSPDPPVPSVFEVPPPPSTPDSFWNKVTQGNDGQNSYRGTNNKTNNYFETVNKFNDVDDVGNDYDVKFNNYYDEPKQTTEKDGTAYSTLLPTTAPSRFHSSSTPNSLPEDIPTVPTVTKPTPVSFKPGSVQKTSTSSAPIRNASLSSPSTTLSSRTLRVNNDIKSKALASRRSYLPNKCTENSLQKKCNNDNNLQRTNTRGRGSAHYSTSDSEQTPVNTNRGTPPTLNRARPTLKPSTSIVSKAQEFVDIYRFPPRRPDNVYPTPQVDRTAAKCRKDVCLLPDCSCGGKDIPGNLPVEEVPQIVLITFDDAVNDLNKATYSEIFEQGRKNPNGCPITGTFYVSHEWTDYSQVQNLYADGHEMASHTVSHSFGEQFSQKKWNREVGGQREILAAYGGVKLEDVRGMRAPFLSVGGNKMFKMLHDSNFTYDSSMPVYENRPPSWPYTLDYKLFHDCMIPPCPTKSYPGVWEVPMVMWQDLNGGRCSMGDACSNPPNAEGVYKMLLKNFDRHYTTNRAPFGLFYHAAWFTQPHHKEGFIMFLDTINAMKDVFLVTNWQAIQWVRDPTPLSRINSFQPFHCNYQDRPKRCNNPKVCNLWHKSGVRYMRTCQPCPEIYPWTGKTGIRSSRIDNEIEE